MATNQYMLDKQQSDLSWWDEERIIEISHNRQANKHSSLLFPKNMFSWILTFLWFHIMFVIILYFFVFFYFIETIRGKEGKNMVIHFLRLS